MEALAEEWWQLWWIVVRCAELGQQWVVTLTCWRYSLAHWLSGGCLLVACLLPWTLLSPSFLSTHPSLYSVTASFCWRRCSASAYPSAFVRPQIRSLVSFLLGSPLTSLMIKGLLLGMSRKIDKASGLKKKSTTQIITNEMEWFNTTKHIIHKKHSILIVILVVRKNNNDKLYSYIALQQRLKQQ